MRKYLGKKSTKYKYTFISLSTLWTRRDRYSMDSTESMTEVSAFLVIHEWSSTFIVYLANIDLAKKNSYANYFKIKYPFFLYHLWNVICFNIVPGDCTVVDNKWYFKTKNS